MCLAQSVLLMDYCRFVIFSIPVPFTSFIFAAVHVAGHNLTLDFSLLRFHCDEIALLSLLCCGSRRLPFSTYAEEDARY